MNRCSDCNSLLTKDETVCMECGRAVIQISQGSGFVSLLKVCLVVSILYLVASMFWIEGSSTRLALIITCGLLFATRSAQQSHAVKRQ